MVKKLSKGEKNFRFYFNLFHIFNLPIRKKKQNHLLFPPFLSSEVRKPQGKCSHEKFFFLLFLFFLFCIVPLLVIGKITTYLFFRNSDLKCPKIPLSALEFHFLQIKFFSAVITRTHAPTNTLRFSDP